MAVDLLSLGTLDGVEVRSAPVGGVVWAGGRLLHLDGATVDWELALERAPLLAAARRRLYVGSDEWVACVDARTGAEVWAEACGADVTALIAHADGVEALAGGRLHRFDAFGRPGDGVYVGREAAHLCRGGADRYVGAPDGIWRIASGERPALLYGCRVHTLVERAGAMQAVVDGPSGTVIVEDDGVPLVWPFPDAATHTMAPWGATEWAVAPLTGRGGVWVVGGRVQIRWQVPLPGVARGLAVAGRAVAVALDDGAPALALIHPDVSTPLLLAVDRVEAIHADGGRLYLTHAGRTAIFHMRET